MNGKIKVLLCDDHVLFRESLRVLLTAEPSTQIIGEAGDGREAVEKVKRLRPDVVLMDISMPELSGFEAARRIVRSTNAPKILILTMYDEDDLVIRCLEAGASGYVLKDVPAAQLIYAIQEVRKGRKYLSPAVVGKVLGDHLKNPSRPKDTYELLSNREREILKLLAEGRSVKEIAFRFKLSVRTVETHKYNLMKKINVHDRTELVKYALWKKLIRLTGERKASNGA